MKHSLEESLVAFTHDLNNLLVGIDGYGRLLQREKNLSEEGKEFLQTMLKLVDSTTEKSVAFQKQCGVRKGSVQSNLRSKKKKARARSNSSSSSHVLVVDDDPAVRKVVKEDLESIGFQVTTAADGQEGISLFQSKRFDCVLLDLSMPVMSGNLVFARLKAISPDTPVIVMSAYISDERLRTFSQIDSTCFIQKPFRKGALLSLVKQSCSVPMEHSSLVENC